MKYLIPLLICQPVLAEDDFLSMIEAQAVKFQQVEQSQWHQIAAQNQALLNDMRLYDNSNYQLLFSLPEQQRIEALRAIQSSGIKNYQSALIKALILKHKNRRIQMHRGLAHAY